MTRFSDRLAAGGLAAVALLLLAIPPAAADEGTARVTDRPAVTPVSHTGGCLADSAGCTSEGACCASEGGCGSEGRCGANGGCCEGGCKGGSAGCLCGQGRCGRGAACGCGKSGCGCGKGGACGKNGCGCGKGGACGKNGCGCGKGGLLGLGLGCKSCGCGVKGCRCGAGDPCRDWDGDGDIDADDCRLRDRRLHDCRGLGLGHGLCLGHGIPIPLLGLPIPCLPLPCLAGSGAHGPLGGTYGRVYALNPNYHDFRDGAVYAAQGYGAPISVPLAPNVEQTMNYGWGVPSSRLTPISRFGPRPYSNVPTNEVMPYGYAPASNQYLDPRALQAQETTQRITGDLPPGANAPTPAR